MKKLFALLLAVMLVVCLATVVSAAETKTVDVAVTVSNNPGFGGYTIQLDYDHSVLKLVGLTEGSVTKSYTQSGKGIFVAYSQVDKVNYMIGVDENVTGNGTLFVATFELKEGAVLCEDYTLKATVLAAGNYKAEEISLNVSGKTFSYGEHTWGAWSTKAADCENDGEKTRTCSACGEKDTQTIPALGHKAKPAVKENEVAATCDKDGKYDEVVYCSVCKEEMSRKTVTIPALGHKAAPAVKEKEVAPTCVMFGSYDEVVYCSVCNEEMSRKNVKVPALGHKPGAEVEENRVEATCTVDGSYDKVVYCTVCKAEVSRETVKIPAPGHKVSKNYANDDKGHYHYCEVCQEQVGEAEAHKGGKWVCTEKTHKKSCTVCGFVMVEGDHEFDENGICTVCKYDSNKDPVPPTGDITAVIVTSAFAMVAAIAAAAYMLKRKFNV